jgi:hypothetical protein
MIRYAIATLALVGGLGYTVGGNCRSEGTGEAVGVVLTADEMAFTVGQSCTTSGAVAANPKPCFKQASNPNSCQQFFSNDTPPKMNCCVQTGGTKGCTAEGSWTSQGEGDYLFSSSDCAKEQVFRCDCDQLFNPGECRTTSGNAGACGSKNSVFPGC